MSRFYSPPECRILVSKWDPTVPQTMRLLTFLDRRATRRQSHHELGAPASFSATVRADDPEVNLVHNDNFAVGGGFYDQDHAFVSEGIRLVHVLRRELPNAADPWVCRFGGIILGLEDDSDGTRNLSRLTAYDPWGYLFHRPCVRCELDPASPVGAPTCLIDGVTGRATPLTTPVGDVIFPAGTRINHIAGYLLQRTIDAHGPCMIDAGDGSSANGDGNDYAGTADWGGVIEDCATLAQKFVIQKGATVGEAWQQLMETGLCKIVLRPLYDPGRPGYCAELSIFRTDSLYDGLSEWQDAHGGIPKMAWDHAGHDFAEVIHTVDGTERANKLVFYGPDGVPTGLVTSAGSVARYGQQWTEEQLIRITRSEALSTTAQKERFRRQQGRRTWQFSPVPELTYRPFQDYDVGSIIDFYHSRRLREEQPPTAWGLWQSGRCLAFDVDYSDVGVETVTGMLVSPDDLENPDAP